MTGVARRRFGGEEALATRGTPVYGEATTDDGWRRWSTRRSKLAAMIERDMDIPLESAETVVYLGAASGTTVSHVADVVETVYAVEFAPRPMRDLLAMVADRPNVIPLLKDARRPETYMHAVEAGVDLLVQDVATRDQAAVAVANAPFLAPEGRLALAIKARSEDVTARPEEVYDDVVAELDPAYEVNERTSLDPGHADHQAVLAIRRDALPR